jgi:hypothetical protein
MDKFDVMNEYAVMDYDDNASYYSGNSNKQKVKQFLNKVPRTSVYKLNRINKEGKNQFVKCYISGTQGYTIKNALTGKSFSKVHKIGSYNENLYFKVTISTGESEIGQSPITLFYDFPEEYEKHMYCEVKDSIKKEWYQRYHLLNN